MTDAVALEFIRKSRQLLSVDYLPKIERCLDALDTHDIWWRPHERANSIGNLVLHLCGNVTMWILGGVGREPFTRDRQREFDERREIGSGELRAALQDVLQRADAVLEALGPSDLLDRRAIQRHDVTVLEAIYHVVEHFGMHTGQIIFVAKMRTGRDLSLWVAPSD